MSTKQKNHQFIPGYLAVYKIYTLAYADSARCPPLDGNITEITDTYLVIEVGHPENAAWFIKQLPTYFDENDFVQSVELLRVEHIVDGFPLRCGR